MQAKPGSLLLKMNIYFPLTTPEGFSKMRAEGTKSNVAEDFLHFVKQSREELRFQENPEKWTELDFG
jgi:hypothetical protein